MSVNLEQFHQVFFEESYEGLDVMESSLMELDISAIDDETINAIFRSAHSIKGGSATFGFVSISEFTHVLETLLDQVRSGERGLSTDDVNLFLKSVDCMREMLAMLQNGDDEYTESAITLKLEFEALLTGEKGSKPSKNPMSGAEVQSGVERTWDIAFKPHAKMFETGNDSLRILQELSGLGSFNVNCDYAALPALAAMQPTDSYLAWNIELVSDKSLAEIEEVFSWVEDDCDLSVSENTKTNKISAEITWIIEFQPNESILACGNEPGRIFRSLSDFGELKVNADFSRLPKLADLRETDCKLAWTLELSNSELTKKEVEEVFEWVADDAVIKISEANSPLVSNSVSAQAPASANAEAPPAKSKTPEIKSNSGAAKKVTPENSSIRVGIDKIDNLINMVGELVITQSMLGQLGAEYELDRVPKLTEGLNQLEQNTRELQESVMKIRMLPISFAFNRFPRMVRDLGQRLGKTLDLEMTGEQTELDKTVMEKIGDPLVHLVRNAVDHGIEMPEERTDKGKNPVGKIMLNAFHQSGNVVIEIIDDGKGLDKDKIIEKAIDKGIVSSKDIGFMSDEQIYDLIFQPGFSTAQNVSDVSGRGVGMDVVKRNILALNGVVEISSEKDKGSKITIRLPLTLAILDGQLVRVGNQTYVFPLVSIIESMQCRQDRVNNIGGGCNVFKLRDDYVPIIELYKAFSIEPDSKELDDSLLVVVESDGEKVGIVVDDLLAQQQVVIKSLEQNFRRVVGASGATILGDGTVALILDIPGIIRLSSEKMEVDTHDIQRLLAEKSNRNQAHMSVIDSAKNSVKRAAVN